MSKAIAMEDVKSISLEAIELIKAKLKEFGITLTDKQEDQLYCPLVEDLEAVTGYPDYRNHN